MERAINDTKSAENFYAEPQRNARAVLHAAGGVPDLEWIKRTVPITDVARQLGLHVFGKHLRCWRPENHHHSDRTPSVGIHFNRNRIKCFVCDAKSLSVVDLVQSVLNMTTFEALSWISHRYEVPHLPKGKHLTRRGASLVCHRVGVSGDRLEFLVRCGLWAEMSEAEIRVLQVLKTFTDPETGLATLSYAAIRRFAGLRSDGSIRKALLRLQTVLHVLEIFPGWKGNEFPGVNRYRLTFEDSRFLTLLNESHRQIKVEIEAERQLRAQARSQRCMLLASRSKAVTLPEAQS